MKSPTMVRDFAFIFVVVFSGLFFFFNFLLIFSAQIFQWPNKPQMQNTTLKKENNLMAFTGLIKPMRNHMLK